MPGYQEFATEWGSWLDGLWVPALPPQAAPAMPVLAGSCFLSLSPTGSQRFSLAGGSQPGPARPGTVPSAPGGRDSADPRAQGPAGGGRRRRPAERRVPGDPGPRARRPERPPSRPAFLAGLIPPWGGPARGRHPARLLHVPPPGSGAPRFPRLGVRGRCRLRPLTPCVQGVPGRKHQPPRAGPGALGRVAQVRRPPAWKLNPQARELRRRAPRR